MPEQLSIFDLIPDIEPIIGTWFDEYPGGDPVPWDEVFKSVGQVFLVDMSTASHIWLKAVRIIRAFTYDDSIMLTHFENRKPAGRMVRRVVWDDGGVQNGMYTGDYWPDEANRRFYRWRTK